MSDQLLAEYQQIKKAVIGVSTDKISTEAMRAYNAALEPYQQELEKAGIFPDIYLSRNNRYLSVTLPNNSLYYKKYNSNDAWEKIKKEEYQKMSL